MLWTYRVKLTLSIKENEKCLSNVSHVVIFAMNYEYKWWWDKSNDISRLLNQQNENTWLKKIVARAPFECCSMHQYKYILLQSRTLFFPILTVTLFYIFHDVKQRHQTGGKKFISKSWTDNSINILISSIRARMGSVNFQFLPDWILYYCYCYNVWFYRRVNNLLIFNFVFFEIRKIDCYLFQKCVKILLLMATNR